MSDVIHALRDASARREAVRQYALAFDAWAEREQVYALGGSEIESAGAHEFALWVLRGYRVEMGDPAVEDRPCSVCGMFPCSVYAVTP